MRSTRLPLLKAQPLAVAFHDRLLAKRNSPRRVTHADCAYISKRNPERAGPLRPADAPLSSHEPRSELEAYCSWFFPKPRANC